MKTGSKFLGLCASIVCAGLVHAKGWWVPITVGVGPVSIVTTGSITYAEFQWGLVGCEEVASMGPVIRNGNNFSYNFELQKETGPGIFCPMIAMIETTTVALGTLAPGDYSFTITSWWNSVVTNKTFTVPTNSSPTLQPIGFAGGTFQIHLNGVTNVSYVLQCTTNFVNWTSLSTNSVGPPLMDPSPGLPGFHYYRVQVLQQ
ncbi:MAG: hypothetical protein WBN75_08345 [Verrucomicrobiia bacterium]